MSYNPVNRRRTAYGIEGEQTLSRLVLSDGFDIVSGQAIIKTKYDSTTPETGALIVQGGGLGVSKNVYIGNDLHVLCRNAGVIELGSDYVQIPSTLQLNSRLVTDILPNDDSLRNLGNDELRWNNLSVNQITNPGSISIFSESTDDDVGVTINKLRLSGPFNVTDNAHFGKDVTIDGHTEAHSATFTTDDGDFNIQGPGNFNVETDEYNTHCQTVSLSVKDTVRGVSIATEDDGVPFFFGNQNSICTFNGKLVLVKGDLEVQGGTTIIQSQTVTIADKNIELGIPDDGTQPTDATADGGGVILKGDTDKFIQWFGAGDAVSPNAWGFSDNIDVYPGKYVRTDTVKGRTADSGLSLWDDAECVLTLKGGRVGLANTSPEVAFQIDASDAIGIPWGDTSQRPDPSVVQFGMMRYNTDQHCFEGYNEGPVWTPLGGCKSVDQQTYITVMADDNITNNNQLRIFTAGTQVAVIDESGRFGLNQDTPVVSLQIDGSDAIRIPIGSDAERPLSSTVLQGMVRYNTDRHRYEGFMEDVWSPLGGLMSLDADTFITMLADDNLANEDQIRLFTAGSQVAVVDQQGRLGIGTTSPVVQLQLEGVDALKIAVGSTSERPDPSLVTEGMIRYNSEIQRYEGYGAGGAWVAMGGVVDIAQSTYISVLSDDLASDVHRIRFFTDGNEVADLDDQGRLGLGTLYPQARLSVSGGCIIGSAYCADLDVQAPDDGLIVQTCLGVGLPETIAVLNIVDLAGRTCIGSSWAGVNVAPADGLLVQGVVGIGTSDPLSYLDLAGNIAIGETYAGSCVAPENGLLVEGIVGIGTPSPEVTVDIIGHDAMRMPVGSQAERPDAPDYGMIRYNTYRNRYEAVALAGSNNNGQQVWMALNSVCNDTGRSYISTYDPMNGFNMEEIWFYTSALFSDDAGATSGLAMRIDSHGNVGIGGSGTRALGSIIDIQSPQTEQFTLRYDDRNYATMWIDANGNFRIKNYAANDITHGDFNLQPSGTYNKVLIGNPTDLLDPANIPVKLSVLGYIYTSQAIKFPDGSLQDKSTSNDPNGRPYGQWYLGDATAGAKKMWQPIDTTLVAIGTDLPTGKLTVASASGDDPAMTHLELRYSDDKFGTFKIDSSGTMNITSGLQSDSDILLNPTGNVGVLVDSAAASLHVNYDLFLQANNSPNNTTTSTGLYMRYQTYQNSTPAHGLIAAGNNSTATPAPLYISASQLLINPVPQYVGISTSTPQSQLSVGGNMSLGQNYASDYGAPVDGMIVEGCVAVGTHSTSASFEAFAPTQSVSVRATQRDADMYGLVVGNTLASTTVTDGLRVWSDDICNVYLESYALSSPQSLNLQPSAGKITMGSATSDAQLTITQPSTVTNQPVLSMHQANGVAPFTAFTGTAIAGNITNNLVVNDVNVTAATIKAFVQVHVTDTGGVIPAGTFYMPLYTLIT